MEADYSVSLTSDQIRAAFDDDYVLEELDLILDKAQGDVTSGQAEKSTILITVTKGNENG